MGFNTTVVVSNDALHTIAKDPDFGKNLAKAIQSIGCRTDESIGVSATDGLAIHCSAAEVVECHHADDLVAIAIGCNGGTELGYAGRYNILHKENKDEQKIEMLRNLAESLGYTIRKNPKSYVWRK